MDFVLRWRREIIIFIFLAAAYFILRLPNLTLQPIFADEAIYIRWAQVMRSEPTLRFLPLSDGKTPLFMWTMMPFLKAFKDPLFAGRFLSVISGFFTLLGVFFLSRKVFNMRVAFFSSLLYAVTPYTVFFDRMALVDSMLSGFTVWALFLAIWLAQKVRLDLAMILGFLLGGAILTKTPGMINLFLLPLTIQRSKFVKLTFFWVVAAGIALIMYNALRLGPNFHLLSSRNADYVFSPLELVGRPLDPFIPHLRDIADWFPKLLTWPVIGFMIYGLWVLIKTKNRLGWVILLWALIPLLLNMAFLRTFTARYLLPSIPFLLIFAGVGLEKISNRILMLVMVMLVLLLPLKFDYALLTNPPPSALPQEERKGYFEQWTAGYGFKDIAKFLTLQKEKGLVVVGTEGFFGTLPDGLYIYLDKANIAVIGSHATISAQIKESAKDHITFFVGNKNNLQNIGDLEEIKEYPKIGGDATVLYKVR